MSVSTGTGLRLTSASIRHMSAQLVPDLAEERDALRTLLLRLHALRPLAVHHPEDASAPRGLRNDHVHGIRGRRVHGHDFRHLADRPQDVDRIGVLKDHDEEVARSDRERILRGKGLQAVVVPLNTHEARPRGLAKRDAELDPGDGPDEGFVDVLRGLDEVGLPEDHVEPAWILNRDQFRVHLHRRCIGPRELKSCCRRLRVRYVQAEGREASFLIGGAWLGSMGFGLCSRSSSSCRSGSGGPGPRQGDDWTPSWSSGCSGARGTSQTTGRKSSRSSTAPMCPRRLPSNWARECYPGPVVALVTRSKNPDARIGW